jgi:signal transduction histidine kinase
MTAVIDTLLVAARAEAQRRDAACDAVVTAGAAAESCRRLAERRGVRLVVKGPPGPVRVPADEELLERILFPLIENGCRYAAHEVIVEVVDDPACVGVHIFDDGPGVSDAERDAIFEPGGRGSAGEEDEHGAGLGLSLARRLARQLGGDVAADPGGDGGHFHVELPRSR